MAAILESWEVNARHWIDVLDAGELESRKLVTNAAVVNAIERWYPGLVLDAGCGEGWLCRALQREGIATVGVDGVAELIHDARLKGDGHYEHLSFEDLLHYRFWPVTYFDVVVFNFCLYENELTSQLLKAALRWVPARAKLVIQTLHPLSVLEPGDIYADGWKNERWAGLPRPFTHPYRWYYRTIGSWVDVVMKAGWELKKLEEPIHPRTGKPASLLITAEKPLRNK
jgi:2-polyprenyl-3-methyl-5-hydroxy-6-metoxy-1,4-benzoquinol methylase